MRQFSAVVTAASAPLRHDLSGRGQYDMGMKQTLIIGVVFIALGSLSGCNSVYYGTWEKLGFHKRDILVERVEDARDDQEEAKVVFADALEQFQSVVTFDGGDLEPLYKKLKSELADCESRAKAVRKRIASVEKVAGDLFVEWDTELEQYTSDDLRRRSQTQLNLTKGRYAKLITAMRRAEEKMEPVLAVFRDQVLFLKHNLNAKALASLEGVVVELDRDVTALIADMQRSIDEANAFIKSLE